VQQARRDNIPDQLENKVVHAIVCRGSKLDFESLIDDLRYSSPLEIIYLKSSVGKLFISDRDPHRASSLAYAEGMGCTPIAKKGKG